MIRYALPALAVAAAAQAQVLVSHTPSTPESLVRIVSDSEIVINEVTYRSWDEVAASGHYNQDHTRCGHTPSMVEGLGRRGVTSSDCNFSRTTPGDEYDPGVATYRIPVVVHVIQNTGGTGFIPESRVRSQIDILNEDFRAIPGSEGEDGDDAAIEFYLATEDPQGNPTSGITYSTNNSWFNDSGSYWNSLAWDPDRYLNIYTNTAGGALGYVPDLPQGGIAGSTSDRVVVLYSTFGRGAPFAPFNLGRTGTHEVGHYLGLLHTFSFGCPSATNCYTTGDLICDTNPESFPTSGCPGSRTSCGSVAPFDNYMDYTDDLCMRRFTPEQNRRMRCTLLSYRPNLYDIASTGPCSSADLDEPLGVLDFNDVSAYLTAFQGGRPNADLALPIGVLDFNDVLAYLNLFQAGCP